MLKWQSTIGFLNPEKSSIIEELIKTHVTPDTNCIEVGVFCGKSLMHLLEVGNPKHVFAIDPFEGNVNFTAITVTGGIDIDYNMHYKYDKVLRRFKDFDNVTIYKEYSPLTDQTFPDIGYAYIDGNHCKQEVLDDAEWIYSLMNKGVIVFADYSIESVKEALNIFAEKYKLEVCFSKPIYRENTIAWIIVEKG